MKVGQQVQTRGCPQGRWGEVVEIIEPEYKNDPIMVKILWNSCPTPQWINSGELVTGHFT